MTQKPTSQVEAPKPAPPGQVSDDERFWQRYSPHHEFPLSSAVSIAVHVLSIALLVFGGILAARWGLGDSDKPIPLGVMDEPGGGGDPVGQANATGGAGAIQPTDSAAKDIKPDTVAQNTTIPKEELSNPTADPLNLPKLEDPGIRWIDESNQALAGLAQLDKDARQKLFNSLGDRTKGQGGSGSGGGKGAGHGTGAGAGTGTGEGTLSKRQKRVLRWEVNFRVNSPEDHLRQFAALGAILALPDPQGRYHVYRDLTGRPPLGRVEDLSNINRIWFIDRNPETVAGISSVLHMRPPPVLVAFFPQTLENEMAEMEQQYRGQKEDDIREKFLFQVVPTGGTYKVRVSNPQP